jgi:hypothetical protein
MYLRIRAVSPSGEVFGFVNAYGLSQTSIETMAYRWPLPNTPSNPMMIRYVATI